MPLPRFSATDADDEGSKKEEAPDQWVEPELHLKVMFR
jgi:hypothetical protein